MKNSLYIFLLFLVSGNLKAQTVVIPDYRFEQALIDLNIDSDGIINGQILMSDALNVTELNISEALPNYPFPANDFYEGLVHDLTGLEAFINLESLTVSLTMVEELNVNTLVNLKYLYCADNMLTSIDVSNNPLLEYLDISSGGDVYPMNHITAIDLSNNPDIHTLIAMGGVNKVNLNNGNNNSNMFINVGAGYWVDEGEFYGNVCIEVDDVELTQNNQFPYSEWTVHHAYKTYSYTDNVTACALNTASFFENDITMYPNPASDSIVLENLEGNTTISIIDFTGKLVYTTQTVNESLQLDLTDFTKGIYLVQVICRDKIIVKKLIVN